MSYDEHLISVAGGDGETVDQLAAIEARGKGKRCPTHESCLRADLHAALAIAREQAAKLDAIEKLAEKFQAAQSSDIAKRENAQFDLGYSAGRRAAGSILRAAITATEEGK